MEKTGEGLTGCFHNSGEYSLLHLIICVKQCMEHAITSRIGMQLAPKSFL